MECTLEEASLRIDIVIPRLRLALEYHGHHHYMEIASTGSQGLTQQRDEEKRNLLERNHYPLIESRFLKSFFVPFVF